MINSKIKKHTIAIILVSIVAPIFIYVKGSLLNSSDLESKLYTSSLISLIAASSIYLGNIFLFEKIIHKYSWKKRPISRILIGFILSSALAIFVMMLLSLYTYNYICLKEGGFQVLLFENLVLGFIINLFVIVIYESSNIFSEWKKSIIKTEQLERENLKSKYDQLKNQINPHFLFNCLNTLSALINQDTKKAEQFISEFSKIYRYSLDIQEQMLVSVKEELEFLDSYIFLQKIRFDDGLIIIKNIRSEYLNYVIPPFAIQLLVENAIKHNIISKIKPLKIELYIENDFLAIKNNLQIRKEDINNSGVGLLNLKKRYDLLEASSPKFIMTKKEYLAYIPLIQET